MPLVIRGPGIPQGKTAQDLAINADLAPTITQVAGAKPRLEMDGESLLPAAEHPRKERGRELLIEAADFHGIRTQRYVYIEYKTGERELYDLDEDPYELQNVADNAGYERIRARLALRLAKLDACKGETCRMRPRVGLKLDYRTAHPNDTCARNPIRARVAGRGPRGRHARRLLSGWPGARQRRHRAVRADHGRRPWPSVRRDQGQHARRTTDHDHPPGPRLRLS